MIRLLARGAALSFVLFDAIVSLAPSHFGPLGLIVALFSLAVAGFCLAAAPRREIIDGALDLADGHPNALAIANIREHLKRYHGYNRGWLMTTPSWILLTYKVPAEPAKGRVGVWRKIKAMGAVYLQNGVCLLPKSDDHLRSLKMLENEITALQGEAVLLETVGLDKAQESKVIARFRADRDEEYREFLGKCDDFEAEIAKETEDKHFTYAELEENDEDLKKLRSWLAKIGKLDFYGGSLSGKATDRLAKCEGLLDGYARQVFEAQEENRDAL